MYQENSADKENVTTQANPLSANALPSLSVEPIGSKLAQDEQHILAYVNDALEAQGIASELISRDAVRASSVLYMTYWYHRLHNNNTEQSRVFNHLCEYIGDAAIDRVAVAQQIVSDPLLRQHSGYYVNRIQIPAKTVDLVVVPPDTDGNAATKVLCLPRSYYPIGSALPGGFITEADEDNNFGIPPEMYAGLRIAATKILGLGADAHFSKEHDENNQPCFVVKGASETPAIRIYPADQKGYHFRENIKSVLRPADPRHIVDTHGLRCELIGEPPSPLHWVERDEIQKSTAPGGGLAFDHHREIISHITAQTSVQKQQRLSEHEFVRGIVKDPLGAYHSLQQRFKDNRFSVHTSVPELFPMVDRLLQQSFSPEINDLCKNIPLLAGVRDKSVIALRQVSLKNRTFCPYQPTLRAIFESMAFFDLVAREQRGFYETMSRDSITEHNPATTPNASYHMYRYRYRLDELMSMLPHQIIIPTFESLSATDLMRVRGVPIFFIGLTTKFAYVDEFEQSPEEFAMHDANHSWRMANENQQWLENSGSTPEEFYASSVAFANEYLESIRILKTDSEEAREIKKLKKMILFEIVHEDARPFLRETICKYIQMQEGAPVPFEVPRIDKESGYMDVVDTTDTGISTLSYVRNKLQHGFYDHVDATVPQIVSLEYRSAEWITRAAYEMLVEFNATPEPNAELDELGHVSYDWLLNRTCSVGPDNIHPSILTDEYVKTHGDGADRLNPKRYQV